MASGIQSCTTNCYNFFIDPFQQGIYNLRDVYDGTKTDLVAQSLLTTTSIEVKTSLSLPEKVSKTVVGLLLLIPIVNLVVMALLKQINSQFICNRPSETVSVTKPSGEIEHPICIFNFSSELPRPEPCWGLARH